MTRDELLKKTATIEAMTKKLVGRDGATMSENERIDALGRRGQLSRRAQRASEGVRQLRNEAAHAVNFAPNPTQIRQFHRDVELLENELQSQAVRAAAGQGNRAGPPADRIHDCKPVKRGDSVVKTRRSRGPRQTAVLIKGALVLGVALIAAAFK
ncbi:hypothetical protein [Cupriavidus pinatubonensis]|uniref:DUF4145 domain-containing protein n=1 Tax=Cupriavidus pinatubonensis TaxID=248026 RepID=A0ABN7ZFV6_9BURK|nr:hypothetical protein [Cupriavidus pinatubonensis]CAG9183885.1 hypothetical protein LMG23994_05255 [Cupriavidus pinatubonensis]